LKNYDVIVIGSGCGAAIADEAVEHGLKVAMVDKGPLGGTCLTSPEGQSSTGLPVGE
jgi:dihydrolipoamide dehydrogenase